MGLNTDRQTWGFVFWKTKGSFNTKIDVTHRRISPARCQCRNWCDLKHNWSCRWLTLLICIYPFRWWSHLRCAEISTMPHSKHNSSNGFCFTETVHTLSVRTWYLIGGWMVEVSCCSSKKQFGAWVWKFSLNIQLKCCRLATGKSSTK